MWDYLSLNWAVHIHIWVPVGGINKCGFHRVYVWVSFLPLWESVIVGQCILPRICIQWLMWFVCIICTILDCIFVVCLWAAGWLRSSHNLKMKGWWGVGRVPWQPVIWDAYCTASLWCFLYPCNVKVVVRSHSPLNQTFHGIFLGLGYVKCFFVPLQRVKKTNVRLLVVGVLTESMRKQCCWFRGNSELQRVWWVVWGLAKITQLVFDRHCIECDLCCEAANGSPQAIFDGCDSVGMLHLTLPDCLSSLAG